MSNIFLKTGLFLAALVEIKYLFAIFVLLCFSLLKFSLSVHKHNMNLKKNRGFGRKILIWDKTQNLKISNF